MKLSLGLVFGGAIQVRPPAGMAAGQTIAMTPTLVDGVASGEIWPPEGAVAAADFEGGRYYASGSVTTFENMFDEDTDWAATGIITPGSGYNQGGNILTSPGSLLSGYTAVAQYVMSFDAGASAAPLVGLIELPGYSCDVESIYIPSATRDAMALTGEHKFAATLLPDATVSLSLDGAAVVHDETLSATAGTPDAVGFGGTGDTHFLRSIAFYPPQLDADLPALSS